MNAGFAQTGTAVFPPRHQYFPPPGESPWFPQPSRGRWIWVPDTAPTFTPPGGCDACRHTGICSCVRPERDVMCVEGNGPGKTFTVLTVTTEATGSVKLG